MANKKFGKIAALLLLATFGLTACDSDEIKALPSYYSEDKIVTLVDGKDIYNNIASTFYDEIHDGSFANDVLDEVLYEYAQAMLGRYNKVSGKNYKDGEKTLKEIANDIKTGSNAADVNEFIRTHKAYWTVDADKNRLNDANEIVANPESADASDREKQRVLSKWESIEERIAEAMYEKISTGSYSYRNIFEERKFLSSLRFDGKKVGTVDDTLYKGLLTVDVEPKDVFTKFLTRAKYQANYELSADETAGDAHYVEDEIIPTIYRSLLTEQYLLDETYNSLGRAYARKINVITISNNDNYDLAAPYLMNSLVKKINSSDEVTLDTFKAYANVMKGVNESYSTEEQAIADALDTAGAFIKTTAKDGTTVYYKGTDFGDMMEKFDKIDDDPLLTDTSIEADFTGSNTYTKETGKDIKTDEIKLKDYTTTGWFTKSSGVDGLPSTITSRLFHVSVANALDNDDTKDRKDTDFDADKENDYVAKINGKYYLKTGASEQGDDDNDILFYDRDSKTYYIVQVEEAVNSTKFSKKSSKSYAEKRGDDVMEEFVNSVLKIVAKSDSNESLSKKHWLSEMNLEYHDQAVYDYFKANFPELFDDED